MFEGIVLITVSSSGSTTGQPFYLIIYATFRLHSFQSIHNAFNYDLS